MRGRAGPTSQPPASKGEPCRSRAAAPFSGPASSRRLSATGRNPTANPTMGEIIAARFSRRGFLQGSLAVVGDRRDRQPARAPRRRRAPAPARPASAFDFTEVEAGVDADHHVAEGYDADVLLRWGDPLFPDAPEFDPTEPDAPRRRRRQFGYNNDYRRLHPDRRLVRARPARRQPRIHQRAPDVPRHRHDRREGRDRGQVAPLTKEQVDIEMAAHGGTIVEIRKADGKWQVVRDGTLQPPHHRHDRDGGHRPGRRPRPR